MQVSSEVPTVPDAPPESRPAAPIIRCGADVVAVSLSSRIAQSSLSSTEARLQRFVEIGFRKIEVVIDERVASDPTVSAMLSRIAGLLANTDGQITIRTCSPQLIG